MGITRDDFLRLLPIALRDHDYTLVSNEISFCYQDGSIQIKFSERQQRILGALVLPVLQVDFIFSKLSDPTITHFLNHFSRVYQRGGG